MADDWERWVREELPGLARAAVARVVADVDAELEEERERRRSQDEEEPEG